MPNQINELEFNKDEFNTMLREGKHQISQHKNLVLSGYYYFIKNNDICKYLTDDLQISLPYLEKRCQEHDNSKFSKEELNMYCIYWYQINKNKEITRSIANKYLYSWMHHVHFNEHHPEHWIVRDGFFERTLQMPTLCVVEMILDWWAFSLNKNLPMEIYDFYEKRISGTNLLHASTQELVEEILEKIRPAISDQTQIDSYFKQETN